MNNELEANLNFVDFLWKNFDYVIFDFDHTMSKEHLALTLEKDGWKDFTRTSFGYISNPEFFKLLVNNAHSDKHVFIFTHGNNENGIIQILENDLGKNTTDRINIIAGRTLDRLRSDFKHSKSLGKDQLFEYHKNKRDMFEYVKTKFNKDLTKYNTVFFDDTSINLDTNQSLGYCTRVDVLQKSDGFNINQFPRYKKQIQDQLEQYKREQYIDQIAGYNYYDTSNVTIEQAKKSVKRIFNINRSGDKIRTNKRARYMKRSNTF